MPVNSSALNATTSVTNEVTARWVLAYSASLDLTDAIYLDDARPRGPVVPPTFCVCLEWTLAGDGHRSSPFNLTMAERRQSVHALQDSRFHAPVRVGMRVTTTGTVAFMRRTSAGAFVLSRLETREAETGDLLTTTWSGGIYRGVDIDTASAGVQPDDVGAMAPAPGSDAQERAVLLPRTAPIVYSECARIWNPIHSERAVALAAGLPDIIVHGTLTWAAAAREVTASAGGDFTALRRLSARFRAPVIAGQSFVVRHGPADPDGRIGFNALLDDGSPALSDGLVVLGSTPAR